MRHPVECDAPTQDGRVAVQPLPPKRLAYNGNIGPGFFLRQKAASQNWMNADYVQIICGYRCDVYLHRFAQSGKAGAYAREICGDRTENCLAVAEMPKTRHGTG